MCPKGRASAENRGVLAATVTNLDKGRHPALHRESRTRVYGEGNGPALSSPVVHRQDVQRTSWWPSQGILSTERARGCRRCLT